MRLEVNYTRICRVNLFVKFKIVVKWNKGKNSVFFSTECYINCEAKELDWFNLSSLPPSLIQTCTLSFSRFINISFGMIAHLVTITSLIPQSFFLEIGRILRRGIDNDTSVYKRSVSFVSVCFPLEINYNANITFSPPCYAVRVTLFCFFSFSFPVLSFDNTMRAIPVRLSHPVHSIKPLP